MLHNSRIEWGIMMQFLNIIFGKDIYNYYSVTEFCRIRILDHTKNKIILFISIPCFMKLNSLKSCFVMAYMMVRMKSDFLQSLVSHFLLELYYIFVMTDSLFYIYPLSSSLWQDHYRFHSQYDNIHDHKNILENAQAFFLCIV